MNTQHSPGPWAQAPLSAVEILGPDETMIATSRYGMNGISREQAVANARLIAAAPELLAALQELNRAVRQFTNADESDWPELVAARAAIAKATGKI